MIVDRGDHEIGAARLVRKMLVGGADSQLRPPLERAELRQGAAKLGSAAEACSINACRSCSGGSNRPHAPGIEGGRSLLRYEADDRGPESLGHVGDDSEQVGVRAIDAHAGEQS